MAADRPNKPRRTPKVAGRGGARIELSQDAAAKRAARAANADTSSESSATGTTQRSEKADVQKPSAGGAAPAGAGQRAPSPARPAGRGLRKPAPAAGESGVERKRQRVEAERQAAERDRARTDVEPGVRNTGSALRLASILGAVAVVIAAIAAILAFHPGADVSDNRAFVDRGETDQVLSEARDVGCAPFRFDYENLDKWNAKVGDQLTGTALDQFRKFLKSSREMITQTKAASECRADVVGVSELEDDRAVVVADMVVSTTRNGAADQSTMPHVQFTLVKRDGDWRLSDLSAF
ncbi:hypothetical protein [Gordonia zhaorongruii]|uniref:hypothetical protein n=1 Tax=Gordonia zhaorongruii TaxID=2597659 RepID=UPI001A9FBF4A|nr:hypothetical protein [Gordonia zhaorongruii]